MAGQEHRSEDVFISVFQVMVYNNQTLHIITPDELLS